MYKYTGIVAIMYSLYALMKHYALSGEGLITPQEAKKLGMDHIIDVRTRMEWNAGRHRRAIHIPTQKISDQKMKELGILKNDKILVYCNTGQRARYAAEKIRKLGYKKVYYAEGGYWTLKHV